MVTALLASAMVTLASVVGVFFFGKKAGRLEGIQRFVVPAAVGVFLSLVLNELIPETITQAPKWGSVIIAAGFLSFYVLAHVLHRRYHHLEADDCDRKGAAMLILIGDGIHNISDGVVLGGAFLIDPAVGFAVALGLALHEIPQEIVEFGVLVRAGFSRTKAMLYNLLSASSIFVGTIIIMVVNKNADQYVWIITGLAAGNLLFLAASDLLPRIHGNLRHYGSIWYSTTAIIVGFVLMTAILTFVHEQFDEPVNYSDGVESTH
tara:strand:- start:13588 stop:14376 length:789 start_codon:yes stop_codon:yes gene_type:complete